MELRVCLLNEHITVLDSMYVVNYCYVCPVNPKLTVTKSNQTHILCTWPCRAYYGTIAVFQPFRSFSSKLVVHIYMLKSCIQAELFQMCGSFITNIALTIKVLSNMACPNKWSGYVGSDQLHQHV